MPLLLQALDGDPAAFQQLLVRAPALGVRKDLTVWLLETAPASGWSPSAIAHVLVHDILQAAGLPWVRDVARHPEPRLREAAAYVLFHIAGLDEEHFAATQSARAALLADPDPRVCYSATLYDDELRMVTDIPIALASLASPEPKARAEAIDRLVSCKLDHRADEVVDAIARCLADEDQRDYGVRWKAALGLHQLGQRALRAAPALLRALADPNPRVRIEAAVALCACGIHHIDPEPAVSALERCLAETSHSVRRYACEGLGDALALLGSSPAGRRCADALARALADPAENVVQAAQLQLARAQQRHTEYARKQ